MLEQQPAADLSLVDARRRGDREQRVQLLAVGRQALAAEHRQGVLQRVVGAAMALHVVGSHSSPTAIRSASRSAYIMLIGAVW